MNAFFNDMQEKQANTTLRYKPGQSSSRESLVTALHSIPRARFPWYVPEASVRLLSFFQQL